MKVVISCDSLIERNHCTEIIEFVCELYGDADIYTLTHQEGEILGVVEQRNIRSSGLSHKAKSPDDLKKMGFLIPTFSQKLFIPCSVDLIINISSGFSHGIKKCAKTKMITYLYDFPFERKTKFLRERFFKSYLKNWSIKKLEDADVIWASSDSIKNELGETGEKVKVVPPFFKVSDFPIIPSKTFKYDYYVINAKGLTLSLAKEILKVLEEKSIRFCFIGDNDFLKDGLKDIEESRFLGAKCNGELAPLFSGSRGFLNFEDTTFPILSLSCLATGRPVMVLDNNRNKEFLIGEGVFFFNKEESFSSFIESVESEISNIDSVKVHAQTNKFHNLKFRGFLEREIKSLGISS